MIIRIIGDIHGKKYDYEMISTQNGSFDKSIQVGDMGVGFGQSDYWHESLNTHMKNNNAFFIRGNHDNPSTCREMDNWIIDGTVQDDIMFIGGAWSIDHQWRTEGVDWWADEELSQEELNRVIDVYCTVKPKIVISHDTPLEASYEMFIKSGRSFNGYEQIETRTGRALQTMFEFHQPKFHFFGHWHDTRLMEIKSTTFICLGECDYADFDTESEKIYWNGKLIG